MRDRGPVSRNLAQQETPLPLKEDTAPRRKSIILTTGMPGAGKTSIGRRLAARLGSPFRDADAEIESAAGIPITEIFAKYGEPHFRDGERRVITRLVAEGPLVLATGGAFADAATRAASRPRPMPSAVARLPAAGAAVRAWRGASTARCS